ncbi:sodium:solute symporter family transporter [Escherichia coli]
MSGWLLMGLPGAVFLSGISESWIAIGLTLGAWINWKLVAGRLRVHTEYNNNALTLPDYFTGRFEDKLHFCIIRAGDFAVLHHLLRFGHCGRRASV